MKTIYRKLKDYIYKGKDYTTTIIGDLASKDCIFRYENPKKQGEICEWKCEGAYFRQYDFLLDYYVIGIFSTFEIKLNVIKTYLLISLSKEKPEL